MVQHSIYIRTVLPKCGHDHNEYIIREHIAFYDVFIIATDNTVKSCTFRLYYLLKVSTLHMEIFMSHGLASSQKLNYDGKWLSNLQTTTGKLSAVISILGSWRKVPGTCFFLCFDQVYNSWQYSTVSGFSVLPIYRMGTFDLLLQKDI